MDLGLKGLRAVVTGGTKGIGRAIADTLAAEGTHVAFCARNAEEVAATQAALAAKGVRAFFINASTACGAALQGCVDGCAEHPGVAGHRAIAQIAAPVVAAAMGWPMGGSL